MKRATMFAPVIALSIAGIASAQPAALLGGDAPSEPRATAGDTAEDRGDGA